MQHNIQKHNRCHKIDIHQIINKFVQLKFPPVQKMFGPKMFGSKMLGPKILGSKNGRVQKYSGSKNIRIPKNVPKIKNVLEFGKGLFVTLRFVKIKIAKVMKLC